MSTFMERILEENADDIVIFMNQEGASCYNSKSQYEPGERKIPEVKSLVEKYASSRRIFFTSEIPVAMQRLAEQSFWNGFYRAKDLVSYLPW